jgi:hypothetical protein
MTPPRCVTRLPRAPYGVRPLGGTRNMTVVREGVLVRRLDRGVRRRCACSDPQQSTNRRLLLSTGGGNALAFKQPHDNMILRVDLVDSHGTHTPLPSNDPDATS